jgi:hypothetical protein
VYWLVLRARIRPPTLGCFLDSDQIQPSLSRGQLRPRPDAAGTRMHPPVPPHLLAAHCTLGSLTVAFWGLGLWWPRTGLRAEWSGPGMALLRQAQGFHHWGDGWSFPGPCLASKCSVALEPTAYLRAACAFSTQLLVFIFSTRARQDEANRCKTKDRRTRADEYRRCHTSAPCLAGPLGWALALATLGAGVAYLPLPLSRLTNNWHSACMRSTRCIGPR